MIKGAKLKEIDELEKNAILAVWNAKAQNGKKVSVKKLFDAEKHRQKLEKNINQKTKLFYTNHYNKAQEDLKKYFTKGG